MIGDWFAQDFAFHGLVLREVVRFGLWIQVESKTSEVLQSICTLQQTDMEPHTGLLERDSNLDRPISRFLACSGKVIWIAARELQFKYFSLRKPYYSFSPNIEGLPPNVDTRNHVGGVVFIVRPQH